MRSRQTPRWHGRSSGAGSSHVDGLDWLRVLCLAGATLLAVEAFKPASRWLARALERRQRRPGLHRAAPGAERPPERVRVHFVAISASTVGLPTQLQPLHVALPGLPAARLTPLPAADAGAGGRLAG